MNSVRKSGLDLFFLAAAIILVLNLAACSQNSVSPNDGPLSGSWNGAFSHPDYYAGYLTMNISQSGNSISGSYNLDFYYGYSDGPKYDGNVTGTVSQSGYYNISLLNSDFTYNCNLSLSSDSLNGSWVSVSGSKSGSVDVHKK
jgi:hypothetical protein